MTSDFGKVSEADLSDLEPEKVLDLGLEQLRKLLPGNWQIQPRSSQDLPDEHAEYGEADRIVDLLAKDYGGTVLIVGARTSLTPAQAQRVLAPKMSVMQAIYGSAPVLVIAPWLSLRTQQVLAERGVGYLDLTGNVRLEIPRPTVLIRLQGAKNDPRPRARWERGLSGARAARLVRLLADVSPPYRSGELAKRAGLSEAYVSRLLDVMEQQALITRHGHTIVDVKWDELLRSRASTYSLLRANRSETMIAPNGTAAALKRLSDLPEMIKTKAVITGTVAADAIAPLVVGGQLMLYVQNRPNAPREVARELGLLPAEGGDVVLLRAADDVVFERCRKVDSLWHVALSQLVLDCLSGPGRLPAAGEAVLNYMYEHPDWRVRDLTSLDRNDPV